MVALRMPGMWRARRNARVTCGVVISMRSVPAGCTSGSSFSSGRRAVGDDFAVINVRDVAAALGFVHVVRGHKKRDAVPGKFKQQIPKLAPRYRIDARRRFVKKKQLGFVQHRATESQPLLPAAGKLRRQAVQIGTRDR